MFWVLCSQPVLMCVMIACIKESPTWLVQKGKQVSTSSIFTFIFIILPFVLQEEAGAALQVVDQMKILGTIVKSNLSWDDNCYELIRKVNARMQLLRGVQNFGASKEEMVHLWIIFGRSVLEQSCMVWHSSLKQENSDDLERTKKSFVKLVLREKYSNYEDSLVNLNVG